MLQSAPPLMSVRFKTRQIAFAALSPMKRDFFTFAFPGFFNSEPARLHTESMEAEFSEFSADRVLDLRGPDARAWFYDAFSDFSRLSGLLDPILAEALAHERPDGPSFEYMLPILCNKTRGGGWQSQVIGIVMRRLGVEALVFPSARCDPEVHLKMAR